MQAHQLTKSVINQSRPNTAPPNQNHRRQCFACTFNHSMYESINQSINQLVNQSISRSINEIINQSIKQPIDRSINQSNSRSINQSINRSIKQNIIQSIVSHHFIRGRASIMHESKLYIYPHYLTEKHVYPAG